MRGALPLTRLRPAARLGIGRGMGRKLGRKLGPARPGTLRTCAWSCSQSWQGTLWRCTWDAQAARVAGRRRRGPQCPPPTFMPTPILKATSTSSILRERVSTRIFGPTGGHFPSRRRSHERWAAHAVHRFAAAPSRNERPGRRALAYAREKSSREFTLRIGLGRWCA